MEKLPVFICYRQSDGMKVSSRIYQLLHEQVIRLGDGTNQSRKEAQLDVYFDQAAPGVEDWTTVHEPYLKRARAIIVVCTPGAKLNEGPRDWVHREIEWWLEQRDMAPILVDPLDEGMRYVPESIGSRWPNAQRIKMVEKMWDGLSDQDHQVLDERLKTQFLGAIVPSADNFYRKEMEAEKQQAAKLKRIRRAAFGLGITLAIAVLVSMWVFELKEEAVVAKEEAERATGKAILAQKAAISARKETESALELVQLRVIESQAARTATEAKLLDILQQFKQFDAYKETMRSWEDDFRTRADGLQATIRGKLPRCIDAGGFTVYERQMVRVELNGLPKNKAMFAYLAVVPGSSPTPQDWAPAVLDIFFGDKEKHTPSRDIKRPRVLKTMQEIPAENQWGLLVGFGAPHVLTYGENNYRIKRTRINMNDEGDMIMAFDICVEERPKSR